MTIRPELRSGRSGPRTRTRLAVSLGGALVALMLLAPGAGAVPDAGPVKATPSPFEAPDLPGCFGNLNATLNHGSGVQDHGRDSKGPGWYFRDGREFQQVRADIWTDVCGPGAGVG